MLIANLLIQNCYQNLGSMRGGGTLNLFRQLTCFWFVTICTFVELDSDARALSRGRWCSYNATRTCPSHKLDNERLISFLVFAQYLRVHWTNYTQELWPCTGILSKIFKTTRLSSSSDLIQNKWLVLSVRVPSYPPGEAAAETQVFASKIRVKPLNLTVDQQFLKFSLGSNDAVCDDEDDNGG